MNRNIILGIAALIILLFGIGGYAITQRSHKTSTTTQTQTSTVSETDTNSDSKSLKELFAAGTSQQCSFNAGTGTSGTVYIGSGKMRGDFTANSNNKVMTTHMISDGKTSYMWMEGEKNGFKMSFDLTNASPMPSAEANSTVDVNTKSDYNCSSWGVDASKFTLPTDVTFSDMSSVMTPKMPAGSEPNTDLKAAQCAACDKAPAGYQDQCKQSLGCS